MKIALASCRELPGWEVDDIPLHAALEERGVEISRPAWDDSAFSWEEQDAVLIRTTWDYWDRRDDFVAWAKKVGQATAFFNPPSVIAWNTDKRYLQQLSSEGVLIAPTVWLDREHRLPLAQLLDERGWEKGFLKPVIGAAASDTLRFTTDAQGIAAAEVHLDETLPRVPMMLQPYLSRVEDFGEVSFLFFAGEFSHAVQKIPVGGDYRVQDDFGAKDHRYNVTSEEIAMARNVVVAAERVCPDVASGDLLYARVDFLKDDHGRWILTELELVEPSLFFRHYPEGAVTLADALIAKIRG